MKKILVLVGMLLLTPLFPAFAEDAPVSEMTYILNTFSFLVMGILVMWMAAGFGMLESGLVRSKNVATICLKNIALFGIAGILFYLVGYNLMYVGVDGGYFGSFGLWAADDSAALGGDYSAGYSAASDWFFQMVFCGAACSVVSGCVAERVKIWSFFAFCIVLTGFIYPIQGSWVWGGGWLSAMKKVLLTLIVLMMITVPAAMAAEASGDVYAGFSEKYLWRGFDLSSSVAVAQGGMDVSVGKFTFSYWSNMQALDDAGSRVAA
ncbi:MAG: hypothetical protein P1P74_09315 [Desulfuromonadales bacterium]|nr:hypothetical protein [Desulfuromonadales bacterium]